ncbi:MAG TPA: penicillin-binding transpeptidase domain-containing protein [Candidatus Tyrphobacter sp.]|nr:penicillin-binding transpeptidase domain-containing protein [Candidatus Tyrphobacter sp.]
MTLKGKRKVSFDEVIADSISPELGLKEQPLENRIFKFVWLAFLVGACLIFGRLFSLGVFNHGYYADRALANVDEKIPIIAPRGLIVDRTGVPLAANQPVWSVSLNVSEMLKSGARDKTFSSLQNILALKPDDLLKTIARANLEETNEVVVANDITRDQVIAIQSLDFPYLNVIQGYARDYISPAFSTVTGYVGWGADNIVTGKAGLEEEYDNLLRGKNGYEVIYRNALGKPQGQSELAPKIGETLKTTIDAPFQEYFYKTMLSAITSMGQTSGVGLAINPQNGEILSLISFPSYDANKVGSYLTDPNHPLFNRAVSGQYSPGSTIKPLVAAAALKERVISPTTQIFSPGYLDIPNPYDPSKPSRFMDWQYQGWVDLYSALAKSSDVYFYEVGGGFGVQPGLGIEKLNEYWRAFGLGRKSGIDFPGEAAGLLPDPNYLKAKTGTPWLIGNTYNVAIGQGDLLVTPLQLVDALSAIANGGVVYEPHLNLGLPPKQILNLTDLEPEFKEVRQGMEDVVSKPYGTAYTLHTLTFLIAGKSGSAQTHLNKNVNALFVGYTPTEHPKIMVLVLIENAREGSLNATPIVGNVLNWYYENRLKK